MWFLVWAGLWFTALLTKDGEPAWFGTQTVDVAEVLMTIAVIWTVCWATLFVFALLLSRP